MIIVKRRRWDLDKTQRNLTVKVGSRNVSLWGKTREEVRKDLGTPESTGFKSPASVSETDYYKDAHIFYNADGIVTEIEITNPGSAELSWQGFNIWRMEPKLAEYLFPKHKDGIGKYDGSISSFCFRAKNFK